MNRFYHKFQRWFSFAILCLVLLTWLPIPESVSEKGTIAGSSEDTIYAGNIYEKADVYSKSGKLDSAILFFGQAGKIFKTAGSKAKYAMCMNKLCEQYVMTGALDQGRMYAMEALKNSREANDRREEGGSYNNLGAICNGVGRPDSAMYFFKKALSIYLKDKGENQLCVGEVYSNLAILYHQQEDYGSAMNYIRKSASITEKLAGKNDDNLSYIYFTAGTIYHRTGNYSQANAYYKKALAIWYPKYGDLNPLIGVIYNGMGQVAWESGNYTEALIYLKKARSIIELNQGVNDPRIAGIIHNIANVYVRTKDYKEALSSLHEANRMWSAGGVQPHNHGLTLNSIGHVYFSIRKYDSAQYYYLEGIRIAKSISDNNQVLANLYSNLGVMYVNTSRFSEAKAILTEAIQSFEAKSITKHWNLARFYHNLGNCYFDQKSYADALSCLQKSIICNVVGFDDNNIYRNPKLINVADKLSLLYTLESKASIFAIQYYRSPDSLNLLRMAFETVELAAQLVDSIRAEKNLEDTQWMIDRQTLPYPNAIQFAYLLYHRTGDGAYLEKAFGLSEKSRYNTLYKSIRELEARSIGGIPDSVQDYERGLKMKIALLKKNFLQEKFSEKPDPGKLKALEQEQFTLNVIADSLRSSFERNYPDYYRLKYETRIATISEVSKKLAEDEVLIEYALTDNKLITFVITPYTSSMISTPVDASFERDIDQFRQLILRKDVSENAVAEYSAVAGGLFETLLGKAVPLIKGKKLIIIPDGKIGVIPFEALINNNLINSKTNFKSLPYLVRDHSIGYGYSATIFLNSIAAAKRPAKDRILAFAPSFNPANKTLRADLKERGADYIDLAGAKEEVKALKEDFDGVVFLDTAATKQNFLRHAPDYKILHVSTHGIINDTRPLESKLVFYQPSDSTDADLHVYELFNLKLNANLVVLSACNTGFGKIADGEGIMSLASGFIYSGVYSLISTLWGVNDKSTAIVIKGFYRHLYDKEEKPVALRNAQIDYLNSADNITAHPYYWAGFLSIGNSHPIAGSNLPFILITALGCCILLVFVIFMVRKKRNSTK